MSTTYRALSTALGFVAASVAFPAAGETLDLYGSTASTSVANCPSFCTSFDFGPSDGGLGILAAESSFSTTRGSGDASSALAGDLATPLLRARSTALPGVRGAFASTFASQGYTYNGPTKTLTLSARLTGSLVDPTVPASSANLDADVIVFNAEGYTFTSDRGSILFESSATVVPQSGDAPPSIIDIELLDSGAIDETDSVTFDVTDGFQFYVWTRLNVSARSNSSTQGVADAFNTLSMTFDDVTGLTPAAGQVPSPASGVLALLALVPLVGRRPRA